MTSLVKARYVLRDLAGLGANVVSLMMTKADRKPVDVFYRVGHLNGDTFQVEGNIFRYLYAQCKCGLSRMILGI